MSEEELPEDRGVENKQIQRNHEGELASFYIKVDYSHTDHGENCAASSLKGDYLAVVCGHWKSMLTQGQLRGIGSKRAMK